MDHRWKAYRRRRGAFWAAIVLAPFWFVGPGLWIRSRLVGVGVEDDAAFLLQIGPMLVLLIVAHLRRMLWPCPRCGRPFHVSWWYGNTWSGRCVNCGLPKWAPTKEKSEADFA